MDKPDLEMLERIADGDFSYLGREMASEILDYIAKLETQQWQPITGGERVRDDFASIAPVMNGAILNVDALDDNLDEVCYSIALPDNIRLCRKASNDTPQER